MEFIRRWRQFGATLTTRLSMLSENRRYEIKAVPAPTEEEIKQARIAELKGLLAADDYKIRKCAEYNLLGLEPPYDIGEIHRQNEAWRAEINELEQQLS